MLFRKPISREDDAQLLRRMLRNGDKAAATEIFNRYRHLVFGVSLKYLGDVEEARDATLAIFEKLLCTTSEAEVMNPGAWLHTLTRNHCLSELRRRKAHAPKPLPDTCCTVDESSEVEWKEQQEEELVRMEEAVNALDEGQRTCIRLFYLEERSYRDIVALTGFTEMQVKSFIQNGRRNLRLQLTRR